MNNLVKLFLSLSFLTLLASGCATSNYSYSQAGYISEPEHESVIYSYSLDTELENKILALDPEHISENDIELLLSEVPAPRVINIHGGIYPVYKAMVSFSKFLITMGYPEDKIRIPNNGAYSYSCYTNSEKLAGYIAWYYEREGLRPLIIGHSQGGMQAVKVLHQLAGNFNDTLQVWNPLTKEQETRNSIIDPLTGIDKPVVGLSVAYASAVGSGGLTRALPNQWKMNNKLRHIPDSVESFTGFYTGMDVLGGDMLGFGSTNEYSATGNASIRNVKLPTSYSHVFIPLTRHLTKDEEIKDWINNYKPQEIPLLDTEFSSSSKNILWAADVWHSIKKHWTLEAQHLINARRSQLNLANSGESYVN